MRLKYYTKMKKNLVGNKYSHLTVVEMLYNYQNKGRTKVVCKCDCGNIVTLNKNDVQTLHTQSCGCLQRDMASTKNKKDWSKYISSTNIEFIEQSRKNNKGQWLWKCRCPYCNSIFEELPARINNNHVKSCGCINTSINEKLIECFLLSEDIKYSPQYSFSDLKSDKNYALRFDFAILKDGEIKFLIEYDGQQHFQSNDYFGGEKGYNERVRNDNLKNEYCKNNNIKLYRFNYKQNIEEIRKEILNAYNP